MAGKMVNKAKEEREEGYSRVNYVLCSQNISCKNVQKVYVVSIMSTALCVMI